VNEGAFIEQAAAQLADVIGAMVGAAGTAVPGDAPGTWERVIRIVFSGKASGTVTFAMDAEPAVTLSRLVMGLDEAPPEPSVIDTLKEVCGQAIGGMAQQLEFQGLRVGDAVLEPVVPAGPPAIFAIAAGEQFSATVGIWALLDITSRRGAPHLEPPSPALGDSRPSNLDVILDIDLPLTVRFGQTEMTLQRLTRLAPGSVIDLGRSPDDPVDVLVNGRLIARGEVVVVAGNYGVRVTEVISASDRWRAVSVGERS